MIKSASILLADDHRFLCELLAQRLADEPGLEVLAAVGDSEEALASARRHRPDLVILDIDMPGRPVFSALAALHSELPEVRTALLSAHASDRFIEQALRLGVRGYILKTEPLEDIVRAIVAIVRGGVHFSQGIRRRAVTDPGRPLPDDGPLTRLSLLTPREAEILTCVSQGLPKKRIAADLHISIKTVDHHCTNLMAKLGIHDRVELARFAIREGLTTP